MYCYKEKEAAKNKKKIQLKIKENQLDKISTYISIQ